MAPALTSCCRLSSDHCVSLVHPPLLLDQIHSPECVILSSAPVALRCTRISLDFARRMSGPSAPERAILALFSSCVARFVMQPTALHCTSTLGDIIWRIRGASPPRATIKTLFSATWGQRSGRVMEASTVHTIYSQIAKRGAGSSLDLDIGALEQEEDGF